MYVPFATPYPKSSTVGPSIEAQNRRNNGLNRVETSIDIAAAASTCLAPVESFSGPVAMIDAVQTQTTAVTAQIASALTLSNPTAAGAPGSIGSEDAGQPPTIVPLNPYDFGGAQPQSCNGPAGLSGYQPLWGDYSAAPCSGGAFSNLDAFASKNPLLMAGAGLLVLLGLYQFSQGK